MSQDVIVTQKERVSVPAGTFPAFKVDAQARVQSLLPSWPGFVLRVVQPFVPRNTLYFEATASHRLLKQEGRSSLSGPQVTLELVRYCTAGKKPESTALIETCDGIGADVATRAGG